MKPPSRPNVCSGSNGGLQGLSDFMRHGQGIDPRTNRTLRRTPDRAPTLGYQPELRALIEKAAQAGQAS